MFSIRISKFLVVMNNHNCVMYIYKCYKEITEYIILVGHSVKRFNFDVLILFTTGTVESFVFV